MERNKNVRVRSLTPDEINRIMDDARQLQAQVAGQGFRAIGKGTAWLARRIWSWARLIVASFNEALVARRTYEQLSRLTERELADIGLTRGDIPAVAAGVYRRQSDAPVRKANPVPPKAAEQDNMEQRFREAA